LEVKYDAPEGRRVSAAYVSSNGDSAGYRLKTPARQSVSFRVTVLDPRMAWKDPNVVPASKKDMVVTVLKPEGNDCRWG
jgi:hypothetical protein